jgi:hypothetical protein
LEEELEILKEANVKVGGNVKYARKEEIKR